MWPAVLLLACAEPVSTPPPAETGQARPEPDSGVAVEQLPAVEGPHPVLRDDVVHTFSLTLSDAAWDALLADPYTYVDATFDGGLGPQSIGVRLKGWSSFRPLDDKPSLKLDFDRTVDGGRFYDLEGLDLAKEVHDLAAISEFIAYRIYRDADLPAPRTGFAQLWINDLDYGFYTLVERRDDQFIQARWEGDPDGSLYESSSESWPCDLDDPGCDCFEVDEVGAGDSLADLEALCAVATDTPDDSWLALMETRLDWTVFTRSMAMEMALGTYDHYAGFMGNFYLYHQPLADQWWFTPSSMNVQFGAVKGTSYPCGTDVKAVRDYDGGLLVRRCWDLPACEDALHDALGWVVEALRDSDIDDTIVQASELVAPAVEADPRREFSAEQFHDQIACIRAWLQDRPLALAEELPEPCLGTDGDLDVTTRGTLDATASCDREEPDAVAMPVVSWTGTSLTTGRPAPGFAVGDEVLVWIAQADVALGETVGEHVLARVQAVTLNQLTLDQDLDDALGARDGRLAVVQRVPTYGEARVGPGAVLTVSPWNGETGGVLALRVNGAFEVGEGGRVTVDGLGYRGGPTGDSFNVDGHQGESVTGLGGGGDSVSVGYNQDGGWWQPNGGGGGAHIAGGGGEHAGGATAADSWDDVGEPARAGEPYGTPDLARLTLGSGGGGVANIYDQPGPGGAGGGVLWLEAGAIVAGDADAFTARGEDASAWTSGTWSYGSGGGAGGSIHLVAESLELPLGAVRATGGAGVDFTERVGGDGGAGRVRLDCETVNGEPCTEEALTGAAEPEAFVGG